MSSADTICALSSAPGRAGVAVVRVSGPLAHVALERMAGSVPPIRKAVLRTIREPGTGLEIDRAIVLFYAGPSSFTGEDVAEILLHGGRAVVARILAALRGLGCRLAEPGEFARRAFENGRIDLTEAEGIADLIDAETEAQRVQALRQAGGALAKLYDGWRDELIGAMALMEAAIDFADEADVARDASLGGLEIARGLLARIEGHVADGRRGEILRDGFRVVLAGPPNVGKSSLLNALARRDAAIVAAEAGTTRDVIEVRLDLDGLPVIVSDTAGIREASGEVEREGIRRTIAHGRAADLVLWMMDAREPMWTLPGELAARDGPTLWVMNKTDLVAPVAASPPPDGADDLSLKGEKSCPVDLPPRGGGTKSGDGEREVARLSVVTTTGLSALVARIAGIARERIGGREEPVITQARHRAALQDCVQSLRDALAGDVAAMELCAEDLRRAAHALGRITGRVDAEDVLDQVFGRFCIGK